ncbi:MAG: hypothetical protein HN778_17975 [Prolixibacteraceae bacterium]|jgi:hypothetical protein|nr:hypothetical protein [Prolixibacteraceae bacterium]MBT6765646.1 hypothetical protein [Prolixibacteraceae bacterium]MBT6997232.1 hypothetical protein [Prolixibacteraceae bacterium]MBT7396721.1 hypothetical protein [Prolixibacteraceae bacterium]
MKAYKKNYIGKGTAHESLEIVKVTLNVENLLKFVHGYNGKEYVTIEVARMRKPDDFGRTHTAYVSRLEEVEAETAEAETPKAKTPKKRGNAKTDKTGKIIPDMVPAGDLPF